MSGEKLSVEEITRLTERLRSGNYDIEVDHIAFDSILIRFCLHYDKRLLPAIKELIEAADNVTFWYA